jgi:hypothetical protein
MSNLIRQVSQAWFDAQQDLGIDIESPFKFTTLDGSIHKAIVLVKMFGSPLGTIIVSVDDEHDTLFELAKGSGYYCSAVNPIIYSKYKRDLFIETLDDWGWFGDQEARPVWYSGRPWNA